MNEQERLKAAIIEAQSRFIDDLMGIAEQYEIDKDYIANWAVNGLKATLEITSFRKYEVDKIE